MPIRSVHHRPISLPKNVGLADYSPFPLENVTHIPGQSAAICFFDPNSEQDLSAMRDILKGKQSKKWMDDPHLSKSDYKDWAGTYSRSSFLFAVLDSRATTPEEMRHIRGFVYIYSERGEKFRVRRLEKFGYLKESAIPRYALEVSFAVRPLTDGMQSGSGLMSSALRQSCLQARKLITSEVKAEVEIFAFTDPENLPAQRTLEASGFVKKGQMKYDWDSPGLSQVYVLSWRLLYKKIRSRLLETLTPQPEK